MQNLRQKMRINGYIKDCEAYLIKYHKVIENKQHLLCKHLDNPIQANCLLIPYSVSQCFSSAPCCVCAPFNLIGLCDTQIFSNYYMQKALLCGKYAKIKLSERENHVFKIYQLNTFLGGYSFSADETVYIYIFLYDIRGEYRVLREQRRGIYLSLKTSRRGFTRNVIYAEN